MLDLPKSTYFGRIIAKDKIYSHGGTDSKLKDMFVRQVERIRWLNKIAPDTVNLIKGEQVSEIQVIEVVLLTGELDKRVLAAIGKAIPYKILFVTIYNDKETYTVYYDNKNNFSSAKPPKLIGSDTDSVWDNIIRQIADLPIGETPLTTQIALRERRRVLEKDIIALEKKLLREKQFNKQVELNSELKHLRKELEDIVYE